MRIRAFCLQEQFANPTFPLEEVNTEKDEEWQPLERKYLDGVKRIEEEMMGKQNQLEQVKGASS